MLNQHVLTEPLYPGGGGGGGGGGGPSDDPPGGGGGGDAAPPAPSTPSKHQSQQGGRQVPTGPSDPLHADFVKERQHSGDSGYWTSPSNTMRHRVPAPASTLLNQPLEEVSDEASPRGSVESNVSAAYMGVKKRTTAATLDPKPKASPTRNTESLVNSPRIHERLKKLDNMDMRIPSKIHMRKVSPDKPMPLKAVDMNHSGSAAAAAAVAAVAANNSGGSAPNSKIPVFTSARNALSKPSSPTTSSGKVSADVSPNSREKLIRDIVPGLAAYKLDFGSDPQLARDRSDSDELEPSKKTRKPSLKRTENLRKAKDSSSEASSPSISPKTTQQNMLSSDEAKSIVQSRRRSSSSSSKDNDNSPKVSPPGTLDPSEPQPIQPIRKASSSSTLSDHAEERVRKRHSSSSSTSSRKSQHRRSVDATRDDPTSQVTTKQTDADDHNVIYEPKPPDVSSPRKSPLIRRNSFKKAKSIEALNKESVKSPKPSKESAESTESSDKKEAEERGRKAQKETLNRRSASAGAVLTRPPVGGDKTVLKPPSGRTKDDVPKQRPERVSRRRTKSDSLGSAGSENESDDGGKKSRSPHRKKNPASPMLKVKTHHKRSSSHDLSGLHVLPDRPESPALKRGSTKGVPTQAPSSPRVRRSSSFSKAMVRDLIEMLRKGCV